MIKKIVKTFYSPKSRDWKKKENHSFPMRLHPIDKTKGTDIFIVGFPKSGNTLMQHIIAHLIYGGNKNTSRSLISMIVPDIYTNSSYFRFNETCYFKSHNLPEKKYRKVIYIIRDGREALYSYYHMMANLNQEISLEDLYSGKHKIFNVIWQEHIQKWEENPYGAEILWLKYEDLITNKFVELKRICNFLNIESSDNELNDVVKFTSIEHMKSLENRDDWAEMKKGKFLKGTKFIRSGKLKTYNAMVSKKLISEFESMNSESLRKYYNLKF